MGCVVSSSPTSVSPPSSSASPLLPEEKNAVVPFDISNAREQKAKGPSLDDSAKTTPITASSPDNANSSANSFSANIASIPARLREELSATKAKEALCQLFCTRHDSSARAEVGTERLSPGMASPPPQNRTPSSRAQSLSRFSIDTSRAKSNAPVVSYCAHKLGIRELEEPGRPCDIYWHSVVYADMKSVVRGGGRVNKFPGMTELAKKVSLTQAIRSMRELFPAEYDFYPRSWILPVQLSDFEAFCAERETQSEGQQPCFIVKPDDGAQGTGIYLIHSPAQLKEVGARQLVQEYMDDPYLLPDQLKFDLRVYAVIKSINPLSIYVAREGMARFCTEKYVRPSAENFDNLYAHLTNYSLNKANNAYVHSRSLREQLKGSKRLLSTVFHQMEHKGVRTRRLWKEIKLIVAKTVLAMVPEIMLNYEHHFGELKGGTAPQCFQIMGFDILVSSDGRPVLLEVNSSPSLSVDHSLAEKEECGSKDAGMESDHNNSSSAPPAPLVRSIVDETIKVPLVRDCILLVLDQLQQHYPTATKINAKPNNGENPPSRKWEVQSLDSAAASSLFARASKGGEDDLGLLRRANRPHLSEIFPARYGQVSRHLLVLDRAVYLYLQFVPIKQTLLISLPAIKAFLKKCQLVDVLPLNSLDAQFAEIDAYFSEDGGKTVASGAPALPFHGFLQLLFHIARRKFPSESNELCPSLILLFAHCDSALRRYGVRSTRLRRAEMTENGEEHKENHSAGSVKIYLLPGRMPRKTPLQSAEVSNGQTRKRQPNRTRSLPRKFGPSNTIKK